MWSLDGRRKNSRGIMVDIQLVEEGEGHVLVFSDGDVSNTIYLDKKNRYKLMQILIEEQLKEV
jgi:hypothetical protein